MEEQKVELKVVPMFRSIGSRFSGTAVSPHKNIQITLRNIKKQNAKKR